MRRRTPFIATFVLAAAFFAAGPASAQPASTPDQPEATPSSAVITTMPNQAASSRDVWFAHDLEEAEERSRRSRNALIATSASFGLGVILAGIGVSHKSNATCAAPTTAPASNGTPHQEASSSKPAFSSRKI